MPVRSWLTGVALTIALCLSGREMPRVSAADGGAPLDKSSVATQARMKTDLTYLSSDECEGRGPTTEGAKKAAAYIAIEFKKAGLKPGNPDGTYFQPFTLSGAVLDNASITLISPTGDKVVLKNGVDFEAMGMSKPGTASGDLVFAGFGITAGDYDDFKGLDVKDKIVVVINELPMKDGKPVGPAGRASNSLAGLLALKATQASKLGAQAILFVHTAETAKDGDDLFNFGYGAMSRTPLTLPVFQIKRAALEKMLPAADKDLGKIETDMVKGPKLGLLTGWKANCDLQLTRDKDKVKVKNVIGVVEGSGPLANETVVIGAHYDHLGYGGAGGSLGGPTKKMLIHHGADDNGSGSTAVMELARRFGAMKNREGRRLVFMTFSGEELGLLGSVYYCANPIFPLKDTVAMVNLDMVGRSVPDATTKKNQCDINGLDTAKEFEKLIDDLAPKSELQLKRVATGTNRFFASSDQYSFFQKGLPVIFFFTGLHPQYHRPVDTVDLINFKGMAEIADMAELVIAQPVNG